MDSVVIIQARTSSTRLPGKVLLPISSIPIVILAAKRAANTGKEIIIVTSNEETDDALCIELNKNRIRHFRGDLNNVLKRFSSSVKDLDEDTIVFRLTADNVFPDGDLLDELEQVEGIIFYSSHQLPSDASERMKIYDKVLSSKKGLRFALEDLALFNRKDVKLIEDLKACNELSSQAVNLDIYQDWLT